jgi:putative CocE/NonD family hydrolase
MSATGRISLRGVDVDYDVGCPTRDGTILRADVYRPGGDGTWPVILMRTPYGKGNAQSNSGYAHASWYARQGYMVVVQDCRGRYSSDGEFYPFLNEAEDGYDAVEWAASLPHSNGRVGMYGYSYPGLTQLLPATLRPPSLRTICPGFTSAQAYDGWSYQSGARTLAWLSFWAILLAIDTARRRGDQHAMAALRADLNSVGEWNWWLPLSELPPLRNVEAPRYFFDWLEHDRYDDYWSRWSIDEDYSRIEVPALHFGGSYDAFLDGTVKNFAGIRRDSATDLGRASQKLVIYPTVHFPWEPVAWPGVGAFGPSDVDDLHVRWYDRFLRDGDDDGLLDSPASVYVLGSGWRDFEDWPPPGAELTPFFLHSRGRANSVYGDGALSPDPPGDEPPDVYAYDPLDPITSAGGHSCCSSPPNPVGPACQHGAEVSPAVLVYTSAELERDLMIAGDVRMKLFAASSAPDTDWVVRLCGVDETGCSRNIQEGIVRASFRESLIDPRPITPGEVYEYELVLGPVAVRVPRGWRLRIQVRSSDFPQWDRSLNCTSGDPAEARIATQAVFHTDAQPSHILLPLMADS